MSFVSRAGFLPSVLVATLVSIVGANGCAVGSLSENDVGAFLLDAAMPDAGGAAGPAACRPGDVGTYQPAYHPASAAWQGLCDPALISGFYDACLGSHATTATCAAFRTDPVAEHCAECILTRDDLSHYGPLIDHGTFLSTNVAGCIELTDPSALPCATALQALGGCELQACQANCPVVDTTSLTVYDACADQADQGGCQMYAQLSSCVDAEGDSGLVGNCLIATFADFYAAVVPLFCGAPEVDGAVAPFDASTNVVGEASADAMIEGTDARPSGPNEGGGPNPPMGGGGHDGGSGGPSGSRDASFE